MIVFLSTQDSVEFHHNLLSETICRHDDSDDEDVAGLTNQIDLFKLHGDMDQKVSLSFQTDIRFVPSMVDYLKEVCS